MNSALLKDVRQLTLDAARFFNNGELEIRAKGPKDFVTQVDLSVNDFLVKKLPVLLPGSKVISEEEESCHVDDGYCWIIDPVDGTTNLIYSLPLYAVSIGLLHNREPVLGVVYNPASEEMFSAAKGEGAYLNGKPIRVRDDERMEDTLVLAETNPYQDRNKSHTAKVIERIFLDCVDYRVTGSAALDICYVACGRGGIFLTEKLHSWDCAGGCAILLEAGGLFTNWQGEAFSFNDIEGGNFLASNRKLHSIALEYTRL
jgi:myo-inositol-1(or 4)-monophosphatase